MQIANAEIVHTAVTHQVVVWIFVLFNIAVGSLFITLGPKRLAQGLYDLSQKLANHPYGWLILGTVMGVFCTMIFTLTIP
jgi:hypothetical protein